MRYKKLEDIDLTKRKVLLRLDLNAPIQNGVVTNQERILRSLPTIHYILTQGAPLIIMSHLGRPEENNIFQEDFSLKPVVDVLGNLLNRTIPLYSLDELERLDRLDEICIVENSRFYIGEKANSSELSKRLSELADLFVMDAFATSHRAHASTTGVITFSKEACAGLLLDEELNALSKVKNEVKNSVAVLGGAKISTKLDLIASLATSVDKVILGGGIANTCLAAQGYNIGKSLVEETMLNEAKEISKNPNIVIPQSVVVSKSPDGPSRISSINEIADDEAIYDVSTDFLNGLRSLIEGAETILWNGPLGFFEKEPFDRGTFHIADMIVSSEAFSVAGGGDTISAAEKAGVLGKLNYVSTAGGAFLEFMEGRKLPAIEALIENNIN
jgi:phosphoglycerate kinase